MTWAETAVEAIRADEPGLKLHVEWHAEQEVALLAMLAVTPDRRGQGVARRAVAALAEAADRAGARLAVTPTGEFGASRARLVRFYEGFGFVRNAGPGRDLSVRARYLRQPVGGRLRVEGEFDA